MSSAPTEESTPSNGGAGQSPALTPAKEERKVGRLNLAAFEPQQAQAPSDEKEKRDKPAPTGNVGKLAASLFTQQSNGNGADGEKKDSATPPRAVGKLGVKMMNIPIFAPGAAPPPGLAAAGAAPAASSEAPATSGASSDSSDASAPAASSSASSSSFSNRTAPGKLQASALMSNLNAMLGAGAPPGGKPRSGSVGPEAAPPSASSSPAAAASPSSSSAAAASSPAASAGPSQPTVLEEREDKEEEDAPAPVITHARRARMSGRGRTKPSQLTKEGGVVGAFHELKSSAPVSPAAPITLVSAAPASSGSATHSRAGSSAPSANTPKSATGATEPAPAKPSHAPHPSVSSVGSTPSTNSAAAGAGSEVPASAAASSSSSSSTDPGLSAFAAAYGGGYLDAPAFDPARADEYILLTSAGSTLLKHGKSGKPKEKAVLVTHQNLVLYYLEPSKKAKLDPKSSVNLSLACIPKISVVKGKTTPNFARKEASKVDPSLCFSIVNTRERADLDFQCASEEERDRWCEAINYVLSVAQERREQELLQSAMGM